MTFREWAAQAKIPESILVEAGLFVQADEDSGRRGTYPRFRDRLTRDQAREVLSQTEGLALTYAGRGGIHPLESVDRHNPRPGLRRWVAVNTATGDRSTWKEAWLSIHHDGSVTLAAAVGGHRMSSDGYFEGSQIQSAAIECAVADFMGLIRATAEEMFFKLFGQIFAV